MARAAPDTDQALKDAFTEHVKTLFGVLVDAIAEGDKAGGVSRFTNGYLVAVEAFEEASAAIEEAHGGNY